MTNTCLEPPWNVSLLDLNNLLRAAGVEPVTLNAVQSARDLDWTTRVTLVKALHESVRRARMDAPPVNQWLTASEAIVLDDDGSEAAQRQADVFWQRLTQIVNGCQALVTLGDLSEIPFFIELLKHQPAGHLSELAADVLRRTLDLSRELDTSRLIERAEEWYRGRQVAKA